MARRRSWGRQRIWWLFALGLLVVAGLVWRGVALRAATVDVFFVRFDAAAHRNTLVSVRRPAPSTQAEARLRGALASLLAGPTPEERKRGVVSEIPGGTAIRSVRIEHGVAIVDLTAGLARGGGSASMLGRVWQVVYTATQFREVHAVQILLDGRRVQTLGGEGVLIGRPLQRQDRMPAF